MDPIAIAAFATGAVGILTAVLTYLTQRHTASADVQVATTGEWQAVTDAQREALQRLAEDLVRVRTEEQRTRGELSACRRELNTVKDDMARCLKTIERFKRLLIEAGIDTPDG